MIILLIYQLVFYISVCVCTCVCIYTYILQFYSLTVWQNVKCFIAQYIFLCFERTSKIIFINLKKIIYKYFIQMFGWVGGWEVCGVQDFEVRVRTGLEVVICSVHLVPYWFCPLTEWVIRTDNSLWRVGR